MRQVVLDTETTGLEVKEKHRVIEIGCVELVNRRPTGRRFHQYLNPERDIDAGAAAVHGITLERLINEPTFVQVAETFLEFVADAELVIHNAAFDVGFLDEELRLAGERGPLSRHCRVLDTLTLARSLHPGQKNSLDALCKRYGIDNSHRELHGALLDARILADVYIAMTSGQVSLGLAEQAAETAVRARAASQGPRPVLRVVRADETELAQHEALLAQLEKTSKRRLWPQATPAAEIGETA